MAKKTIEELDFKLILDDKDFNEKVAKANAEAKKLNQSLSQYLTVKKAQGNLSQQEYLTLKRIDNLETNRRINADKEAVSAQRRVAAEERIADAKQRTNKHQETHNRLLKESTSLAASYVSLWGAGKLLKELVNVTAEFELQRTTLRAMLQDAQGADAIYEQIKSLAVVSPFSFKELVTYTKQLAAYSVPIGELYDTTKMLADVSAGIGVGMDRLVLAYGQVRSAAFLRGQEVRQFTEAGIPILDMLAKQFEELEGRAVSTGEVFDEISKRHVPFEMVAKAFEEMTSEGGKFFNMQEIQAETLKGKLSNLKDAYEIMFSEIGNGMEGILKGGVDSIRNVAVNYEQIGKQLLVMAGAYGTARVAIGLYNVAIGEMAAKHLPIIKQFRSIEAFILKNPYTILAAGVALLAGEIYKAATYQDEFVKAQDKLKRNYNNIISEESAELDLLYAKLKSATEGTEDYEKAKKQLYGKYANYIEELKSEGVEVNNLTILYESLRGKIEQAAKARMAITATSSIREAYSKTLDEVYSGLGDGIYNLQRAIKELSLSDAEGQALWGLITGTVTKESLANTKEYAGLLEKISKGYVSLGKGSSGPMAAAQFIDILTNKVDTAKTKFTEATAAMEAMFGSAELGGGGTSGNGTPQGLGDKNSDAIEAIEARISILQKLKEIYDSMRPYFSDDSIRKFFDTNFGFVPADIRTNFDFATQIESFLKALEALGTDGVESANKIRESLGTSLARDIVKEAKDMVSAVEEFRKFMDSWATDDTIGGGKIGTIANKYRDALNKITDKVDEARKKLYDKADRERNAGIWSALGFSKDIKEIDTKAALNSASALAKAKDELSGLADDFVKNWAELNGIPLENWTDMTIGQLNGIRDALKGLLDEQGNLKTSFFSEQDLAILSQIPGGLETLSQAIAKYIGTNKGEGLQGKLDTIADKEKVKMLKNAAKQILELANSLREFGDATGNGKIKDATEGVQGIADAAKDISAGFSSGGWIGAAVAALVDLGKAMLDDASAAATLKASIKSANIDATVQKWSNALSSSESIFGENTYRKMVDAKDVIGDIEEQLGKIGESLASQKVEEYWVSSYLNPLGVIENKVDTVFAKLLGFQGNLLSRKGNMSKAFEDALAKGYEGIEAYIVKVRDRNGFMNWLGFDDKYMSLKDLFASIGQDMYDAFGNLNKDGLQAILDTYDDLGAADREWIESAIEYSEAYADAMKQLDDSLQSLLGDISGDFADAMIEGWRQAGIAAGNYEEILGGIAETYAKMVIQDTLLEKIFNKDFKDKLEAATLAKDTTVVMNLFDEAVAKMNEYTPFVTDLLNSLNTYLSADMSGESLANGIKGITEDTANLLASYVNAIRADVAYGRAQRDEIIQHLEAMAGFSAPNLTDYLNAIQANTYNTAENTRRLLERIDSVMTTSDGPALRVFM